MNRSREKTKKVTIHTVAQRAGVSAMTVSNVINKNGKFSEATQARVLAAIKELGYVPSQEARRLVGSAPARIGLLYPDSEGEFINAILVAASVVTAKLGLQQLTLNLAGHSLVDTLKGAHALVRSGADGLLLFPPFADVLSRSPGLRKLGTPVVGIATATPLPDISTIRIDNYQAAYAVTELLIRNGRRRIAVLTGPAHHTDSVARMNGYKKALQDNDLRFSPRFCMDGGFTFKLGLPAAEKLLKRRLRPDAIIAENDDMAAAAISMAHRIGLELPRDLAVAGFDDSLLATRVWPELTSVRQPIYDMVDTGIELLVSTLRHPQENAKPRDIVFDFEIVERQSTHRY